MTLYFDSDIAKDVGVVEAVLYEYIIEGVNHSRAHHKYLYDGSYWTRESISDIQLSLSFLSLKQVRNALMELVNSGYLECGCYNDDPRDRTKWYTNGRKGRIYDFSCK